MSDLPESLEDSFHAAPCGLLLCARDGALLAVNDTFLDWTGYEREALTSGRHFDDLLTVPGRIFHETHCVPLLHLQGHAHELALDLRKADGALLPALVNAVVKRAPDGSIALLRYAVFSAAQRRSYERQLLLERRNSEQAVRAKSDFLAMFAHEIRNPLAAVLLELDLLERTDQGDPEVIPELRDSLDRVLRLLSNMLEISKLEAGKSSLQRVELELGDVMQAVVHTLRPMAAARKLSLRCHLDDALRRPLVGDPVKLEQALTNLVGNAIKFTETGSVTLAAQRVAQQQDRVRARFAVTDTGIGIASERHARIFEDYEQADASIASRFGGTGLGLAITRKLVELQGGQLAVESEEGRGSTFSFEVTFEAA